MVVGLCVCWVGRDEGSHEGFAFLAGAKRERETPGLPNSLPRCLTTGDCVSKRNHSSLFSLNTGHFCDYEMCGAFRHQQTSAVNTSWVSSDLVQFHHYLPGYGVRVQRGRAQFLRRPQFQT